MCYLCDLLELDEYQLKFTLIIYIKYEEETPDYHITFLERLDNFL